MSSFVIIIIGTSLIKILLFIYSSFLVTEKMRPVEQNSQYVAGEFRPRVSIVNSNQDGL